MSDVRYMISDAAKLVDVEAHVLRYWEEELDLPIGRNEMGHRYYTEENIRLFRQIKELKDQGVQLKAVKMLLPDLEKGDSEITHLLARADKLPISADSQTAAREEKNAPVPVHYEPADFGSAGGPYRENGSGNRNSGQRSGD